MCPNVCGKPRSGHVPRGWATSLQVHRRVTNTIAVRIFPGSSHTGISMAHRRAVVDALIAWSASMRYAALLARVRKGNGLDSLWIYKGFHSGVSRARRESREIGCGKKKNMLGKEQRFSGSRGFYRGRYSVHVLVPGTVWTVQEMMATPSPFIALAKNCQKIARRHTITSIITTKARSE